MTRSGEGTNDIDRHIVGFTVAQQHDGRISIMTLKQENALDDTSEVIKEITSHFSAMNLPRMADSGLYLGMPFSMLEEFASALAEQRSRDEDKRFVNRLRYAGIVRERTPECFRWSDDAYPFAEPGAIESALDIDFIMQRRNLIIAGPPGVGKTLLVLIIACKAVRANFSVKYKTGHGIATELREARIGNSLSGYIKKLQGCDLLIIEDVIFATFDIKTAQSFFSLIDGRYGRKSTAITSNGSLNEWAAAFPDKSMSSAILGRFYEDALLINMNGAEDMRLKRAKGMLGNTELGKETENSV
jgi:DNA replication protein DnaC